MPKIETHPLEPFLPQDAKMLMLGSFPPSQSKWKMNFYYPNFQNDMWRIFGLVFFHDKEYFLAETRDCFDEMKIRAFLREKGIAIGDTAKTICRLNNNAADKFLEVHETVNFDEILNKIPSCQLIVTTGELASKIVCEQFDILMPKIGDKVEIIWNDKTIFFCRAPSSSRAYPLSLVKKAEKYAEILSILFNDQVFEK
ncbi:MAG: uracil-DNA glycosylase family protein [Brevinema sp.]